MTNPIPLNLPPVVERELRVVSRKSTTYWARTAAGASGVAVIGFVMTAQMANAPLPALGQIIFRLLAGMTASTVLGSVLQLASEAFAREKREDTLGLLFLTPLRPFDMVLGKLVSTSLSSFYRFLAIVPVLAVPILAGGVSPGNFVLLVLALLNLIFLGAALGLWVSAFSWEEKRAASWASSLMMILLAVPVVLAFGIATGTNRPGAIDIAALSPGYAIWHAVMPQRSEVLMLVLSLAWTQLLGWIFIYSSCRILPHCWQKRSENLAPKGDHLRPVTKSQPTAPKTARLRKVFRRQFTSHERTALLNRNPLAWFVMRWRPPASSTWALLIIACVGYAPAVFAGINANEWSLLFAPGYALIVIFFINMGIKTFAAHQGSFAFARDRGEDTMDLLLSTPNRPYQLIDAHEHALHETLRPVVGRALWIEGAWLALTIAIHAKENGVDTFLYLLGSAATLALLVPDVKALASTAMWQSVVKKNARDAQQEAFSTIVFLPWLPVIFVWMLGAALGGARTGVFALIISWTIASAIADFHFLKQSQRLLLMRLGLWALRRSAGEFEHYDGWKQIGRRLGRWWALRRARPQPQVN